MDITLDLEEKAIYGSATITMIALNEEFEDVRLNLRRCSVSKCCVNEEDTVFELRSPLDDPQMLQEVSSESMQYRWFDIEVEVDKRTEEAEDGELIVNIPDAVKHELKKKLYGTSRSDQPTRPLNTYPRFSVRVDFRTLDPSVGGIFYDTAVKTGDGVNSTFSYLVTDGRYGVARCWMPCVDSLLWCDKCPWEIVASVTDTSMVVASGDLLETRLIEPRSELPNGIGDDTVMDIDHTEQYSGVEEGGRASALYPMMKRYLFRLDIPAHASEVAVVAGPFRALPDPHKSATVTHFCLPGSAKKLVHTSPSLYSVISKFYKDFFGADPPVTSFKQVFLAPGHGWTDPLCAAGGLAIYPGEILHTERDIDEAFEARTLIARTYCEAYFGRLVRPRGAQDTWFINGLVEYTSSLAVRAILGNNWYRHRIFDLVNEMIEEPRERSPRLSTISLGRPADTFSVAATRRAHIIVHMIAKRVGPEVLKRALRDVVAEAREDAEGFISSRASAFGFDDAVKGLGVEFFCKRLRSICNVDTRNVARVWAASISYPEVQFGYRYNARRNLVEFVVKQPPFKFPESETIHGNVRFTRDPSLNPPIPLTGTLTVRVAEVDGTYDHAVEIQDAITVTELPCHSRRAKAKGGARADKEKSKDSEASYTPINYIIADPELEHPCKQVFLQSQRAVLLLLDHERDATAQDRACSGLARFATPKAVSALEKALADGHLYWRVRASAAEALSRCPEGLSVLLKFFRQTYMNGALPEEEQVLPNQFKDISSYFVKKAVIRAIASVKDGAENTPRAILPRALVFLLQLLESNDNVSNVFTDRHYVALLLRCVTEASSDERVLKQIARYNDLHLLNPDPIVHSSLIESMYAIERPRIQSPEGQADLACLRFKPSERVLAMLSEAGSYESHFLVRRSAFRTMLRLYGQDLDVVLWVLSKVDRVFSGDDILDIWRKEWREKPELLVEPPRIRQAALEAIMSMPSYDSLRRHTKRAMKICVRILRLSIGDPDPRIRAVATDLGMCAFGIGVPVCLLTDRQYAEEVKKMRTGEWRGESQGLRTAGRTRRVGFHGRRSVKFGIEGSPLGLKRSFSEDPLGIEKNHDATKGLTFKMNGSGKKRSPLIASVPIRIPVPIPKLVPKTSIDAKNLPEFDQEDINYMAQVFQTSGPEMWAQPGIIPPDSPLLDVGPEKEQLDIESRKKKRKKKRDGESGKRKKKRKKKRRKEGEQGELLPDASLNDLSGAGPSPNASGAISGVEGASIRAVGSGGVKKLKIKLPTRTKV